MGTDYTTIDVTPVDSQNPPGGEPWIINTYEGQVYYAAFQLPVCDVDEEAILAYRVMRNVMPNKLICINDVHIPGGLPSHSSAPGEWFTDTVHVPANTLIQGQNVFAAGYTTSDYDDFRLESVSLWYKTPDGGTTVLPLTASVSKRPVARSSPRKRGRK